LHGCGTDVFYLVAKHNSPSGSGPDGGAWSQVKAAEVNQFLPASTSHRPRTKVRLLHDGGTILGRFEVEDQFVRCTRTEYGSEVWKDSCVEFFIAPKPGRGYFNFEFNCGGAFLVNHIIDPTRTAAGFKQFTRIPKAQAVAVKVSTSVPKVIEPEVKASLNWTLEFEIPIALLEAFVGPIGPLSGQMWRGNFFKCAEDNSQPHWAAWAPVDEFNFHLPRCFGEIRFQ